MSPRPSHLNNAAVHFLCIGAQRSGTSWLAINLRHHPEIWIPPNKEVHYFSRSTRYASPSHLACRGVANKFFGRSQESQTWRWLFFGYAGRWLARASWREKPRRFLWLCSYFFGRVNDEWYCRLYQEGRGKICGEVTPDYSLLEADDVARVAALLPEAKIILLMRDPLDRVLSQLRYHMDGRAIPLLGNAPRQDLIRFATQPGQISRGDYRRVIETWLRYFPEERIHRLFYEDICASPREAYAGVLKFLGASLASVPDLSTLAKPANASTIRALDADLISSVAEAHEPVIRECAAYLGGHARNWLDRLESMQKKHS